VGTVLGVVSEFSLAGKCNFAADMYFPEANKSLSLLGFPTLGFSLAGCLNF
jgi:hypothetical protein